MKQRLEALVARLREENAAWRARQENAAADAETLGQLVTAVELDRRVRTLEDTVSDLQSRVERLESTAQ